MPLSAIACHHFSRQLLYACRSGAITYTPHVPGRAASLSLKTRSGHPRQGLPKRPASTAGDKMPPVTRTELMGEIDRRWRLIDDLVLDADPELLARRAGGPEAPPEGWTVGEVLLHMAGWKRRALAVAQYLQEHSEAPDDDVNQRLFGGWSQWNAGLRDRSTGVGPDAVMAEHRAAHRDLLALLQTLPDACLLTRGRARTWLRPLMAHTFDHLDADLRPAIAIGERRAAGDRQR